MEGIININKPSGISSFDVIRKLRRILKTSKIGHTGTLDPLADGVLVMCVGKATKLASLIEAKSKGYIAEFDFGYETDTYDTEGKVIFKDGKKDFNIEEIEKVLEEFTGKQKQIPPMYSAIKVNGKKLYELARENIEIEREERDVEISNLNLLEFKDGTCKINTEVSKGTYIRSLIKDIGNKLGTYATMTALTRTKVGEYKIEESFTIEDIENLVEKDEFTFIKSVETIFEDSEEIILENKEQEKLFSNGNTLIKEKDNGFYRIYYEEEFRGLGKIIDNRLKGYKYFK